MANDLKVSARITVVVQSADGRQTLRTGWAELDFDAAAVTPPAEFAARHLWPAFQAATAEACVDLPKDYQAPPARAFQS